MLTGDEDTEGTVRLLQTKRRRLDPSATRATLSKPFRSPFRTQTSHRAEQTITNKVESDQEHKGQASSHEHNGETQEDVTSTTLSSPVKSTIRGQILGPHRPATSSPLIRPVRIADHGDPKTKESLQALNNAQRAQTTLISTIAQTRRDIDALRQAASLASGKKDAELEQLIDRWRAAARSAAEEVFSQCRDKVNRMGGVGAWRERELQQREWQKQWDEPPPEQTNADADDDDEEEEDEGLELLEREERKAARELKRQLEAEHSETWSREYEVKEPEAREEGGSKEDLLHGNDDDTFTMDMMLKMLNIDLDIIGYSKVHQSWVG